MTTLFAFLHHVAAFTLVSALAVELVLIRQGLTLATAGRLPIVDAVLGPSAGILLLLGLFAFFFLRKVPIIILTVTRSSQNCRSLSRLLCYQLYRLSSSCRGVRT